MTAFLKNHLAPLYEGDEAFLKRSALSPRRCPDLCPMCRPWSQAARICSTLTFHICRHVSDKGPFVGIECVLVLVAGDAQIYSTLSIHICGQFSDKGPFGVIEFVLVALAGDAQISS